MAKKEKTEYFGLEIADCPYHNLFSGTCNHKGNPNGCSKENCPVEGIKNLFLKRKLFK